MDFIRYVVEMTTVGQRIKSSGTSLVIDLSNALEVRGRDSWDGRQSLSNYEQRMGKDNEGSSQGAPRLWWSYSTKCLEQWMAAKDRAKAGLKRHWWQKLLGAY